MEDQDEQTSIDATGEYYAILNISRDASEEDVRRAYRNLAQVYHPDKHTEPELKEKAQEAFGKLQEAYEVLSDPNRRQTYDVYGKEGLAAGFELGDKLDSVEDLKRKWAEFRKKQEAEQSERASNHRGSYICRLDATDLRASLAGRRPLLRGVIMSNAIDTPVATADAFYVQGQAVMRNNAGAGNLIFGYRRVLSPHDTLDGNVMLGLRAAVTATSTRQVTPYTSASLTASYTPDGGMGLQLSSTRQLPYNMQATLGWVVGPPTASGVSFNISKRGTKYILAGKVELGPMTALSGRLTYHPSPAIYLRAILRLGVTGMDLELGAGRKWDASTAGYLGTVVGVPQGVVVKGRLTRGGQSFEVPVVVSAHLDDWRLVAAAYVVPPLTYLALSRFVVRPLVRWQRRRQERRQQQEHAEAIRASLAKAAAERSLIEPVSRRKARAEAAKRPTAGLVILDAVYGNLESYKAEGGPQAAAMAEAARMSDRGTAATGVVGGSSTTPRGTTSSSSEQAAAVADTAAAAAAVAGTVVPPGGGGETSIDLMAAPETAQGGGRRPTSTSADGGRGDDSGPGADADPSSAGPSSGVHTAADGSPAPAAASAPSTSSSAAQVDLPPPPPWLNVVAALQYLVTSDSKLQLHPGLPKKNQMGFTDPMPGSPSAVRQLYIAYLYGNQVYEVTVEDLDGLVLPGAGEAVMDGARVAGLVRLGAATLGVPDLLLPPGLAGAAGSLSTPRSARGR